MVHKKGAITGSAIGIFGRPRTMGAWLTIQRHWLPERRPDAKDNAGQDVLETGEQEQGRVLRIHDIAFF